MTNIGDTVDIKSFGESLIFECIGDFASQETILSETSDKNNDGFYTLFPNFGVSISKDTKDDWEINLLKFLSANVPNKHFDFGQL